MNTNTMITKKANMFLKVETVKGLMDGLGDIKVNLDQLLDVKSLATSGENHFTLVESIDKVRNEDGTFHYEQGQRMVVRTTDSAFNDMITDWCTTNLLLGSAAIGKVKDEVVNFSSKIFMLGLDNDLAKIFADTKGALYYCKFDGQMYRETGDGSFINMITDKIVNKLGSGYDKYFPLCYTTGSSKKSQMLFYRQDHAGETWLTVIEKVLPGFLAALRKKSVKKAKTGRKYNPVTKGAVEHELLISRAEFVKIFGRISLAYTSGGKVTDNLGAVAYYHGTFDEISGMSDGAAITRESFAEGLMHLYTGQAIGLQFQPRIRKGILKSACVVSPEAMFEQKILDLMATGKLEILGTGPINMIVDRNNVKLDIQCENDMKLLSIGKVTEGKGSKHLWQKVIYAAAKKGMLIELLEYLTDKGKKEIKALIENIFKRQAKKAKVGSRYIMELLAQEVPGSATLAHSLKEDAVNAILKLINKLGFELRDDDGCATFYNGVVTPDLVTMMTGNQCVLGTDENGKHEVYFGKFSKMIGKLKRERAGYQKRVDEGDKGGSNPNYYVNRVAELTKEIAILEEKYHDCKIIKYPTIFIGEYLDAVLVDSYELEQRILANDNISQVYKDGLIKMINQGSDSMIMFESDKTVYGLLAGMDNDYDKCCIIFDKFINKVLDGNQFAEITLVQKDSMKDESFSLDDTSLPIKMFVKQNDPFNSVGGITNEADKYNTTQSGLYADKSIEKLLAIEESDRDDKFDEYMHFLTGLKDCSYEASVNLLRESVGKTQGVDDTYQAQLSDVFDEETGKVIKVVDDEFSERMAKEIRRVAWTVENVRAFFHDVSKIYRLYQEGIIDSAKTGMHINKIFKAKSVLLVSNMELYSETDDDGNVKILRKPYPYLAAGDIVKVKDNKGNVTDKIEVIEYHDFSSKVQDILMDYFNEEFNKEIAAHSDEFKYSDEDIADFRKMITIAKKSYPTVLKGLINLKKCYNSLAASKAKAMRDITKKLGDEAKKALSVKKAEYDAVYATLANSVEILLKETKLDSYYKGALILAVGCYDNTDTLNPSSSNKFAYVAAAKYAFQFLFDGDKVPTYSDIVVDNVDLKNKTKLDFINGVDAENKVIIKEKYTGKADYHVTSDNKSYVQVNVKVEEIGQVANQKKSDEIMIAITGSGNKEEYLLDKFEMIDTSDDNEIIFEKGQLKTANLDGGWDVINANGKPLFVNTMKERTYYKVTSSRCVYTRFNSPVDELTYVILTAKELK